MTPLVKRRIFLTAAVVTFPLFLVTVLLAICSVNPMAGAFLTSFEIVNETDELLSVTPVGAVGARGDRRPLPLSISKSFSLPGTKRSEFSIPPNSSRIFTYDWDDIQFSEILIRRQTGTYHVFATGLHPTEGQYRRPEQNRFVISDLASLPRAKNELLSALPKNSNRGLILYALVGAGLLFPVFYKLARNLKSKEGNDV